MTKHAHRQVGREYKAGSARQEIPDAGCRGLYLVVQPSGLKSWAVRYRYDGQPKKLTLDRALTLAAARKAATDALHELAQGRDPAALKFEAKASAEKPPRRCRRHRRPLGHRTSSSATPRRRRARTAWRQADARVRQHRAAGLARPDHPRHQAPRRHRAGRGRRRRPADHGQPHARAPVASSSTGCASAT